MISVSIWISFERIIGAGGCAMAELVKLLAIKPDSTGLNPRTYSETHTHTTSHTNKCLKENVGRKQHY